MKSNQFPGFVVAAVLLVAIGAFIWLRSGYGEVSEQTYEFSKAIYGACLAKSEARLDIVESLMEEKTKAGQAALPSHEKAWLMSIISVARAGNWESATKKARRMLQDQVDY